MMRHSKGGIIRADMLDLFNCTDLLTNGPPQGRT
jgi:hypothetical protein